MISRECSVKVGDVVCYERRTMLRGWRYYGPYIVARIKKRPRVVVLTQKGSSRGHEMPWHEVVPWTADIASRCCRDRALDTLATICYHWQTDSVRDDATVAEFESAIAVLRSLRKEVPPIP